MKALNCLACAFLTCFALPAASQAWSPECTKIALTGDTLRLIDIAPASAEPTAPGEATTADARPTAFAAWSPDSKTLVYRGGESRLTQYSLEGGARSERNLIPVTVPAWSPDSRMLGVVFADEAGALHLRSLYRDADRALTVDLPFRMLAPILGPKVAWVPGTDNAVVAGQTDTNTTDLYLIEQGEVVKLTKGADLLGFAVSRDGSRVVWARRSRNAKYILFSLYEYTLQNRTVRRLSFPEKLSAVNPTPQKGPASVATVVFSSDLKSLAFVTVGGGLGSNRAALYVADITGKSVKVIGSGEAEAPTQPQPANTPPAPPDAERARRGRDPEYTGFSFPARPPAFSPDGKRLAALRDEPNAYSLVLVDIMSGGLTSLPISR